MRYNKVMTRNDKAENFLELFQSECVKNSLIEENIFSELYSEVGAEVLSDIIISYRQTLDESFMGLKTLASAPDEEKTYRVCHKLKGSSQLIGFKHLAELCEHVCNDIKGHTGADWSVHIKPILADVASIKEAIIVAQNP